MNSVKVRQLFDYDTWTYTYLLWCEKTKQCLLIDSVLEQVDRDLGLITKLGLKLEYIFETHVHADHITAADTIRSKTDAKVVYGSKTGVNGCDICLKDNVYQIGFKENEFLVNANYIISMDLIYMISFTKFCT